MKNFKLLVLAVIMATTQVQTVDIPKQAEWCGKKISQFGSDLLIDTTTQVVSLSSVAAAAVCYKYYHYNAALVCLDEHPNSYIMHTSNLIYATYANFLQKIESINSYALTLEFINSYCTDGFSVSTAKIHKFIALTYDLQNNNNKRIYDTLEQENMILENFKNNLILAQENIKKELINDAITANKNASNAVAMNNVLEIIANIVNAFNNK